MPLKRKSQIIPCCFLLLAVFQDGFQEQGTAPTSSDVGSAPADLSRFPLLWQGLQFAVQCKRGSIIVDLPDPIPTDT